MLIIQYLKGISHFVLYYLDANTNFLDNDKLKKLVGLCIGFLIVNCLMTHYKIIFNAEEITESTVSTFFNCFRVVFAITIFIAVKRIFSSDRIINPKVSKMIISLGKCTFGIYLIEQIIRERFYLLVYDPLCQVLHPFLAIIIYICFVFGVSAIIVRLLKTIPGLRNII